MLVERMQTYEVTITDMQRAPQLINDHGGADSENRHESVEILITYPVDGAQRNA